MSFGSLRIHQLKNSWKILPQRIQSLMPNDLHNLLTLLTRNILSIPINTLVYMFDTHEHQITYCSNLSFVQKLPWLFSPWLVPLTSVLDPSSVVLKKRACMILNAILRIGFVKERARSDLQAPGQTEATITSSELTNCEMDLMLH